MIEYGDSEDDPERAVDELARAVLEANSVLERESPRLTTAELEMECLDALVSEEGALNDPVRRETRRRVLRQLPDPVFRALLVAYHRKRRRELTGRAADALTLAYPVWIMSDPRYHEVLEEMPRPCEDDP